LIDDYSRHAVAAVITAMPVMSAVAAAARPAKLKLEYGTNSGFSAATPYNRLECNLKEFPVKHGALLPGMSTSIFFL